MHPHAPCAGFGVASHGKILGGRASRSAMPHEARVPEAVATRHIVSVLLRERLELGAISVTHADAGNAEHHCKHKATDTNIHDANLRLSAPDIGGWPVPELLPVAAK